MKTDIQYIVYINCKLFPFIAWIIAGLKTMETRNKNTLKQLIGKTVYFAETGKHKKPVVYCSCIIGDPVTVIDKKTYNRYREQTRIVKGSIFDFTRGTKQKVLYPLLNVQPVKTPFSIPENAIRKNRTFCELI
jgi:hypothetical protein